MHIMDYISQNMGTHLSIDEVALSQGELYIIVTNKKKSQRQERIISSCCRY
jgi:hypothetical protein